MQLTDYKKIASIQLFFIYTAMGLWGLLRHAFQYGKIL